MRFNSSISFASLALIIAAGGNAAAFRHPPNAHQLETRIARETNPVKRAKLEIQLSRLRLHKAIGLYDLQHPNQARRQLHRYMGLVRKIQRTLRRSGKIAAKRSQGFVQFDIALREGLRRLRDLRGRVSYLNQGPIAKTIKNVTRIRQANLQAMFPSFIQPRRHRAADKKPAKTSGEAEAPGVTTAESHNTHGGRQ